MKENIKSRWQKLTHKIKVVFQSHHSPEYIARSVGIGVFIALTPTFGIQILFVTVVWSFLKVMKKWQFGLAVGIAMTWITNYFTVVPYYFICYYCGVWISHYLFRIKPALSYESFSTMWEKALNSGFWDSFQELARIMLRIGKPLLIGSLFFAVIGTFISYKVTKFLVIRHRKKIEQKMVSE